MNGMTEATLNQHADVLNKYDKVMNLVEIANRRSDDDESSVLESYVVQTAALCLHLLGRPVQQASI
jgi:hypothetical protein